VRTGKRFVLWLSVGGVLVSIGVPIVFICQQIHEDNLDHVLVHAVISLNAPAVSRLLGQGANANAKDTGEPPLTLTRLLNGLLARLQHRQRRAPATERPVLSLVLPSESLEDLTNSEVPDSIAVLLIRAGADINVHDLNRMTLLHIAVCLRRHQTVRLLLSRGADVNAIDDRYETPLFGADLDSALTLIEYGADVNAVNLSGDTPLMCSISDHEYRQAKFLIQHGADVNATDRHGLCILYYAQKGYGTVSDSTPIIHILKDHGARLNDVDKEALATQRFLGRQ
jgi:hypothetical protein